MRSTLTFIEIDSKARRASAVLSLAPAIACCVCSSTVVECCLLLDATESAFAASDALNCSRSNACHLSCSARNDSSARLARSSCDNGVNYTHFQGDKHPLTRRLFRSSSGCSFNSTSADSSPRLRLPVLSDAAASDVVVAASVLAASKSGFERLRNVTAASFKLCTIASPCLTPTNKSIS